MTVEGGAQRAGHSWQLPARPGRGSTDPAFAVPLPLGLTGQARRAGLVWALWARSEQAGTLTPPGFSQASDLTQALLPSLPSGSGGEEIRHQAPSPGRAPGWLPLPLLEHLGSVLSLN